MELIGRRREVEALHGAVADAAGGRPVAVVLTGPPGVGKTSLARAGLADAGRSGFVELAGRAHPLSHEVAYAPLAAALGAHLHARYLGAAGFALACVGFATVVRTAFADASVTPALALQHA